MLEITTTEETTLLLMVSVFVSLVVTIIIYFLNRKKYKQKRKAVKYDLLLECVIIFFGIFIVCMSLSLVSTSLFFQTDGHMKKVEHAKIEAIAKEFHVSTTEFTLKEKKHHIKNYVDAETTYDVNIKNETLEVVLRHEGFTKYHVVKVSKVLKERKN